MSSSDKKPFSYAAATKKQSQPQASSIMQQTVKPAPSISVSAADSPASSAIKIPLVDKSDSAGSTASATPARSTSPADKGARESPQQSNPQNFAVSPPSSARSQSPSTQQVSAPSSGWPNSKLPHKKSGDFSPQMSEPAGSMPPGLSHLHQQNQQLSDLNWKAVGSPPRRQSVSFPQTPEYRGVGNSSNGGSGLNVGNGRFTPDPTSSVPPIDTYDNDDDEDLVLSRKRNIRNRTASTPNAMLGIPGGSSAFLDAYDDSTSEGFRNASSLLNNGAASATTATAAKWGGGWPGNQSIWNGDGNPNNLSPASVSQQSKNYRSLSFSIDNQGAQIPSQQHNSNQPELQRRSSFVNDDHGFAQPPSRARTPLANMIEEQSQEDFGFPSNRSRSKSATYGLPDPYSSSNSSNPAAALLGQSPGNALDPMSSIWSNQGGGNDGISSVLHRRSSTQPSMMDSSRWGAAGEGGVSREPLRDVEDGMLGISLNDGDRYRRRHSHAPNMYAELAAQMVTRPEQADPYDSRRRHSLAGPPIYNSYLSDMDGLYDPKDQIFDGIDDYFENTEHRTKAWVEAGKNLQKQASTYATQQYWPVYVIEFKAGRIDYFHAHDCGGQLIRAGDLVIVEADRGKDLGKVIHDNLANLAQLHMFQSQHKDIMVESLISSKEIIPKRIYGLATAGEIGMLVSKAQDEAKAMAVCQAKIRQRKLPMEIVDAEYQWDRKKLTFYFVADRRVDFRELIRDLFKLYKTRIWMCAVDPTKMPRPF